MGFGMHALVLVLLREVLPLRLQLAHSVAGACQLFVQRSNLCLLLTRCQHVRRLRACQQCLRNLHHIILAHHTSNMALFHLAVQLGDLGLGQLVCGRLGSQTALQRRTLVVRACGAS